MPLLAVVALSAAVLIIAYFTYGKLLARLFRLDSKVITPAHELRDDVDYEPIPPNTLIPQHFSAIAAAGPIVGPILAGITFGWAPALIWILVGSILIGGVHDFSALVASVRHKALTIAEVVRQHMSRLSYLLFLSFIWIALVYIIVAFTDLTAASFVEQATEEKGGVSGGAVASSSLLYLGLTLLMGALMRYAKMPLWLATVVFVPLVGLSIAAGPQIPFDIIKFLPQIPGVFTFTDAEAPAISRKAWDLILLVYCLFAAVVPVWLLLQPRGHLGGYFLYFALGAGAIGLCLGGLDAQYPAFRPSSTQPLFPMLFITIACGACSGFHSLIASGTTSKQLDKESDARSVGYGTMLLEAMVAIVSLCCVMMFAEGSAELAKTPNEIYAAGIGRFLSVIWLDANFGRAFALMAFTTFVYDTLDVCTRLGRYIIQELLGLPNWIGRAIGTTLTAGVPIYLLLRHPNDAAEPIWKQFWSLFGASNQLLAALTLLGITVWLWRTRKETWVWLVTGIPTIWMYVMSTWALGQMTLPKFYLDGRFVAPMDAVPWAGVVLLALAAVMLLEGIRVLFFAEPPPPASRATAAPAVA